MLCYIILIRPVTSQLKHILNFLLCLFFSFIIIKNFCISSYLLNIKNIDLETMQCGNWIDVENREFCLPCGWCFVPGLVRREKDWPSFTRLVRFSPQNAKNDLLFRFFSPKRKAGKYSSNKLSLQNRLWLIVNHWKMAATQKHRPRGHRPHTSATLWL